MTAALYTRGAATAARLLAKYGRACTHRAYTAGTYSPSTGSASPSTSDTTRNGLPLDFDAGQTLVRGTLIQDGDKRLLLDSDAPVPDLKDHFIISGIEYTILSLGELNPAGTPVLYDLHLRT